MERIFVQGLKVGTTLDQPFLVKSKSIRQKKTGEPFLSLLVGDRTGEVAANLRENFEEAERGIEAGDFVRIRAFVGSFQGSPQLNIQSIQRLDPGDIDPREFCPSTERDVEEMVDYLRGVAASLENPHLRALLDGFLGDETFLDKLRGSPAAKGLHHVYLGGLLEHTTSVVQICEAILDHYDGIHRDLLLAGAILHDVGKVEELNFERGIADYTDEGRLLGHIVLGSLLVKERVLRIPDFPRPLELELLHILVSHHGEHAWGSPKRPKTVEALIVHHVEDLDAKVMGFQQFMSQSQDPQRPHWTLYHKTFERFLYLREEGRDLPGKERDAT